MALLLGQARRALGRAAAAADAFAAATAAAPDSVNAWLARGGFAMEVELAAPDTPAARDRLDVAIEAFGRAERLAPRSPLVVAQHAMALRYACAWRDAGAAEARLAALGRDRRRDGAFASVAADGGGAAGRSRPAARGIANWARQSLPPAAPRAALRAGAATSDPPAAPGIVARRGDRLRVGYLSSDFHDHATAYLAAGVFERHDRARVESFAYALDRDDGGAMRRRLTAAFDHFADVRALSDADVARASPPTTSTSWST